MEVVIEQPANSSVEIKYYKVQLVDVGTMQYIPAAFGEANITAIFYGVIANERSTFQIQVTAVDMCNRSSNEINSNVMCKIATVTTTVTTSAAGRLNSSDQADYVSGYKIHACRFDHPDAINKENDDNDNNDFCYHPHLIPLKQALTNYS